MRLAIALLVLAAAGCAALRPGAEDALVVREIVETTVDALRSAPEAQRERLAAAVAGMTSRPDDASRLRVAVLLATLPPPLRDEARASAMMLELSSRRPATPLTQFAGLLQVRLAERVITEQEQAQRRAAEKRQEALRNEAEALRAGERGLAEREEALRKRMQALRAGERNVAEREETVRRQLEALRDSERSMTEREEMVRRQVEALRESERSISEREGRLGTKTR